MTVADSRTIFRPFQTPAGLLAFSKSGKIGKKNLSEKVGKKAGKTGSLG